MDQPASRKGVASVAEAKNKTVSAPPSSPETVIDLDVESVNGLRKYKGAFKYTVPSMGDRVDIAALKAEYLQQLKVDAAGDNIAEMLAYLYVTIDPKTAPEWWIQSDRGIRLRDFQPLMKLYAQARAYEATFLGGNPNAGGDEEPPDAGSDPVPDGTVGDDVSAPAERRQVLASFGKRGGGTGADVPSGGEPED